MAENTNSQQGFRSDLEFAPNLIGRAKLAVAIKRDRRLNGEMWKRKRGLYNTSPFFNMESQKESDNKGLAGIEKIIYAEILAISEKKLAAADSTPVVILDFGGMYGMSMLRIAHALREQVALGSVAFVVSNLTFKPEEDLATVNKQEENKLSEEEIAFIKENMGLVHYIKADAGELEDRSINVPGLAAPFSLAGHIDIMHESFVFMHLNKNDVDIPRLYNSFSNYGILFFGSREPDPFIARNTDREIMAKAFQLGKENLVKRGMRLYDYGDKQTSYDIFAKPNAVIPQPPKD